MVRYALHADALSLCDDADDDTSRKRKMGGCCTGGSASRDIWDIALHYRGDVSLGFSLV